jgi:hypothetical protein
MISDLVTKLGMSQEDLSAISGRNTRSVRSWLSGAIPAPRSVVLILIALDENRIDFPWLVAKLKQEKEGGQ